MAAVRWRFWPISLRSTTRKIIKNCVACFKNKSIQSKAIMGLLPAERVTISRPFTHCRVDYAGPFILRETKRRNTRNHKVCLALFVCFATKAAFLLGNTVDTFDNHKSIHVAFHLEFVSNSVNTLRLCSGGECFTEERIAPAIFRQNLSMYLSNVY